MKRRDRSYDGPRGGSSGGDSCGSVGACSTTAITRGGTDSVSIGAGTNSGDVDASNACEDLWHALIEACWFGFFS